MTFGDNGRDNILGIGKIGKNFASSIKNVYLVDGLKYNWLNISQCYDKDNHIWFDDSYCVVENTKNNDVVLHGSRLNNVYAINLAHTSPMHLSCLKGSLDNA